MTQSQTEAAALPRPPAENEDAAADKTGLRKMLTEEQVLQIVPVSSVTLWRMERDRRFPRGTFVSANLKFWFEDEVIRWQNEVNGRRRPRRKRPTKSK